MKKIILIMLIFSAVAGWAQEYNYQTYEFYEEKAKKARKTKSNGVALTLSGAGSLILGGILVAGNYGAISSVLGYTTGLYGIVGINLGIPLWIAGDVKNRNNQKAMKEMKMRGAAKPSLSLGMTSNGVGLCLNF